MSGGGRLVINSHYVPQFILRNFYTNDKITYCDLEKKKVELRNTRSVFSEEGYYPEGIEKDLCKKAEYLFANLYHNKFEEARNTVVLTRDELFTVKKYLIVSAIRYKNELTDFDEEQLKILGPDFKMDYDRSLNEILACESPDDLFNEIFKMQDYIARKLGKEISEAQGEPNIPLWAELIDITHSYLVFVKTREKEKFLIPDVGRAIAEGPLSLKKFDAVLQNAMTTFNPQALQLLGMISPRDYSFYPLSKNFGVLSMNSFYKVLTDSEYHFNVIMPEDCPTVSAALGFGDRNTITPPKVRGNGNSKEYIYDIKNLTTKDVIHLNGLMLIEAKRFVACGELSEIENTMEYITDYPEKDFSFMNINA